MSEMLEMRAQMKMQFSMIESCFRDCVMNFRDDTLSANEQSCLRSCAVREASTFVEMNNMQQKIMAKNGMGGGPQF